MSLSPVIQKFLETRGITCTNDAEFVKLAPWFRFTPLLGAILIGLGTGLRIHTTAVGHGIYSGLGGYFPKASI